MTTNHTAALLRIAQPTILSRTPIKISFLKPTPVRFHCTNRRLVPSNRLRFRLNEYLNLRQRTMRRSSYKGTITNKRTLKHRVQLNLPEHQVQEQRVLRHRLRQACRFQPHLTRPTGLNHRRVIRRTNADTMAKRANTRRQNSYTTAITITMSSYIPE